MIYADYAATTPPDPRVTARMQPYLSEQFYNPSSIYQDARKVRAAVEDARRQAAQLIGAPPERIFFTSGGTESDNLAVLGTALHPSNRKRHICSGQAFL
ncbi:aminotransferase class V-fold PLP-dependent enzyme [Clostridiaceae bacterium]|nr:aminotransferase class V-fold PLP-dependent enzyme [Clostridiaceae bacterium]